MKVSIERGGKVLSFGRGMILGSLEADGVKFGDEFPSVQREELVPEVRRVRLEGYIVATGETSEMRRRETERRRRMLSVLTYPGNRFVLRVDDKYADLINGELFIKREAPFSGNDVEHFVLTAQIDGGFFHRSAVKRTVCQSADGAYLPGHIGADGAAVGEIRNPCAVSVNNGGDIPVGFRGSFRMDRAMSSFVLTNTSTYQKLSAKFAFAAGDTVKVSTLRDDPYFKVTRNGTDINLTGFSDNASELFLLYPGETMLELGGSAVYTGDVSYTEAFVSF